MQHVITAAFLLWRNTTVSLERRRAALTACEVLDIGEQPSLVLLRRLQGERGCHVGFQMRSIRVCAARVLPSQRRKRQLAAACARC